MFYRKIERKDALVSCLLVILQELKDAKEKFTKGELLYVEATGYEGLKVRELVNMLPPDYLRQIYLIYSTLWSINKSADVKNQAFISGISDNELKKFDNIIKDYYKLGLHEIEPFIPLLEDFIAERQKQSGFFFGVKRKTWLEVRNEIFFKK